MSTFRPQYLGECYDCGDVDDVRIDWDTVGNIQLCRRCWDSAGRRAAIEAEREESWAEREEVENGNL